MPRRWNFSTSSMATGSSSDRDIDAGCRDFPITDDRPDVALDDLAQALKDGFFQGISRSSPVIFVDEIKPVDGNPLILAHRQVVGHDPSQGHSSRNSLHFSAGRGRVMDRIQESFHRDGVGAEGGEGGNGKGVVVQEGKETEPFHPVP